MSSSSGTGAGRNRSFPYRTVDTSSSGVSSHTTYSRSSNSEARGAIHGHGVLGGTAQHAGRGGDSSRIFLTGHPVKPVESSVTKQENALNTTGKIIDGFPGRPGFGSKGRAIVLRANFFEVIPAVATQVIYVYQVTGLIDNTISKAKRRRFMEQLLASQSFSGTCATDFAQTIVTNQAAKASRWEERVTLAVPTSQQGSGPDGSSGVSGNSVVVVVSLVKSATASQVHSQLANKLDNSGDWVKALNIILGRVPIQDSLHVRSLAGNKFFPFAGKLAESSDIGQGVQANRGYFVSTRPAINRLLINVNVTSRPFYKSVNLVKLLEEFDTTPDREDALIHFLKVDASIGSRKSTETILGYAKNGSGQRGDSRCVKIKSLDGRYISLVEFYRTCHKFELSNPECLVLNVGSKAKASFLPPEICHVLPGQPYRTLLSGEQLTNMLGFAARRPAQNASSIVDHGLGLFGLLDNEPSTAPFGLKVKTDMITIPGRILPGPSLLYGSETPFKTNPINPGWNLRGQTFQHKGSFRQWKIVVIDVKGGKPTLSGNSEKLFSELEKAVKQYGVSLSKRLPTSRLNILPPTSDNRDRKENDSRLEALFNTQEPLPDLLFIVLPNENRWLYSRMKFYGDVVFGVHTICAVGSKLQPGRPGFFANLALKFNVKGGGSSHTVETLFASPIGDTTMFVGVDITHPTSDASSDAPSIAAIVASIDTKLAQFPGSVRTQERRQEMVSELEQMMLERLRLWHNRHNKCLPQKIVVFRDGVSDGQYKLVLDKELPGFHAAFKMAYGDEKSWPKMAIVIVGKRHHARFYPTKTDDADQNGNPLPGTVVDRGIVGPILHEFYLQAHKALQGTARSAHYVVIKDDIGFKADQLEQLVLKLSYVSNRSTNPLSICTPARYADQLCNRARMYLYDTLYEDGMRSKDGKNRWTKGVHRRIAESTWYI